MRLNPPRFLRHYPQLGAIIDYGSTGLFREPRQRKPTTANCKDRLGRDQSGADVGRRPYRPMSAPLWPRSYASLEGWHIRNAANSDTTVTSARSTAVCKAIIYWQHCAYRY